LQEQEDHQDNEHHGFAQRSDHILDRRFDEFGGVVSNQIFDAGGEGLLRFRKIDGDAVRGFDGVCVWSQVNDNDWPVVR
jgi:hypothetical protein